MMLRIINNKLEIIEKKILNIDNIDEIRSIHINLLHERIDIFKK
jgi:hypothetical protein